MRYVDDPVRPEASMSSMTCFSPKRKPAIADGEPLPFVTPSNDLTFKGPLSTRGKLRRRRGSCPRTGKRDRDQRCSGPP